MFNLDALLTGGVTGAVVAAAFRFIDILMNKKVRSSADVSAQRRADIVERNEMIAEVRDELRECKTNLRDAEKTVDDLQKSEDRLGRDVMALEHYIYRCLGTFHRLGLASEIPKPTPFEKQAIEEHKETNND